MRTLLAALAFFSFAAFTLPATAQTRLVDDFEANADNVIPRGWHYLEGRDFVPMSEKYNGQGEWFRTKKEGGRTFLRGYTDGEAHRIVLANDGQRLDWDLRDKSFLQWDWRAVQLPVGASEKNSDKNDTGAAVYVTFDNDWLGRPRSIKYTYSSTLPVGTTESFGNLKVVVVASALDGINRWSTVTRDVKADYRGLFGKSAPDRPIAITFWNDSDNTGTVAISDFDNLRLR